MNNYTYRAAAGRLLIGAVLLGTSWGVQAQITCGDASDEGATVTCDNATLPDPLSTPIRIEAAKDGTTTMTISTRRAPELSWPARGSLLMQGSGEGRIVVNIEAHTNVDRVDFSANSGGVQLTVAGHDGSEPQLGGWTMLGDNTFGSGSDILRVDDGGFLVADPSDYHGRTQDRSGVYQTRVDFGAGEDRLENAGVLLVGANTFRRDERELMPGVLLQISFSASNYPTAHDLRLEGLETFNNEGLIILGGWRERLTNRPASLFLNEKCTYQNAELFGLPSDERLCGSMFTETDLETANVLTLPGTHFIGGLGSTIMLDAVFSLGQPQYDCVQRELRGGISSFPGADCVDIREGSTSGSTAIVVRDALPGDLGAYNPDGIVIVDVGFGDSAAEHFFLSPDSDGYDPVTKAIDKGLFMFPLVYDAARQQHKLVSLPGQRAYRLPLMVQAVQALSRSTGRQWFERRADLRALGSEQSDGAWVRVSQESASRDGRQSVSAYGNTYGFDNSYDIDSTVLSIGRDFALGDAWVVGASASYINADLDFDIGGVSSDFDGAAVALHASWMHESLYLDSQIQMAWLEMNYIDPRFQVATSQFNTLDSATQTLDVRAELGYRMQLADELRVEPMLGVSWVRSEFGSMTVYASDPAGRPTNEIYGGDAPASLRVSLGGRLSYGHPLGDLRADYVVLGRYWEELRGDTKVRIRNAGPDTRVNDRFDSGLFELGVGVSLSNASGLVSGLLQANAMFGDYESLGVTAGLQVRW